MTKFDIDDRDLWFRCEIAVGLWLESRHGASMVHWANDRPNPPVRPADRAEKRDGAPRVTVGARQVRSPDFKVTLESGDEVYWEVKQRAAAWRDEAEGTSYFWVAQEVFDDYLALANAGAPTCTVQVIVYEGNYVSGRWLRADVRDLQQAARTRQFQLVNNLGESEVINAVLWPVHVMLEMSTGSRPELADAVRFIGDIDKMSSSEPKTALARLGEPGDLDAQLELEQLRKEIGLESFPRYSVLYAHCSVEPSVGLGKILALTDFGLRVFIITDDPGWTNHYSRERARCDALIGSSLLEVSVVKSVNRKLIGALQIDGVPTQNGVGSEFDRLWNDAEAAGNINTRQYAIVHAHAALAYMDHPVVVSASAGSGKTETLSERIIFLLCTSSIMEPSPTVEKNPPYDLRLDEIVLITFTREAAREMRQRITRSLVLRRRLCARCTMPVLAWLSQLGSTNISTIHAFAKKLIQVLGPREGFAADFTVGTDYERFDELVREAVNNVFFNLSVEEREQFPEIHEAHNFVNDVWESLVRNGTNVLQLRPGSSQVAALDWAPHLCEHNWAKSFGARLPEIIDEIANKFRVICRERKLVPTDQLLSIAADLVRPRSGNSDELTVPRYLFIDEFQDTDEQQIDLALHLRQRGTRLFVVGDAKQAIYRFRGAAGDAFELLRNKLGTSMREYQLVRNFRTDGNLLTSMQTVFDSWAASGHLELPSGSRLEPSHELADSGSELKPIPFTSSFGNRRDKALQLMANEISSWMNQSWSSRVGGESKIAVLCRTNRQAIQVKEYLNQPKININCEISKGGDFYRTRAVAELRVLLRALTNPSDLANLLELLETVWGIAIYNYFEEHAPDDGRGLRRYIDADTVDAIWVEPLAPGEIHTWGMRLASSTGKQMDRTDIEKFERRVKSLSKLVQTLPMLEMLSELDLVFEPHIWLVALGDANPAAYERNLDHAMVLLDDAFGDGSLSVLEALNWLNLKANTDRDEEEPDSGSAPDVLAITVHKAKGREFDAVVIPFCDMKFTAEKRTSVTLVSSSGKRRVGWRWWHGRGKAGHLLDENIDAKFAALDRDETVKEETRLLYVAMTRAKKQLTIIYPDGGVLSNPDCWADLLS